MAKKSGTSFGWLFRVIPLLIAGFVFVPLMGSSDYRKHWMFEAAPSNQEVTLKSGAKTTIPFHAYQADTIILLGLANGPMIKDLMKDQDYKPIITEEGNAIVCLWFETYHASTGGVYSEIIMTVVASREPKTVTWNRDPYKLMAETVQPSSIVYIQKLWLNETLPIDYGIEILGLDKHLMKTDQTVRENPTILDWKTTEGDVLLKANIVTKPGVFATLVGTLKTVWAVGLQKSIALLTSPTLFTASTPKSIDPLVTSLTGPSNARAHILGYGDIVAVPYDPSTDKIELGSDLKKLNFEPVLKEISPNYAFVFYPPIVSATTTRK